MARSSKLVAARRGKVLLVRRRRDRGGCFPAVASGRARTRGIALRREIGEERSKLKLGRLRLWKEVKAKTVTQAAR